MSEEEATWGTIDLVDLNNINKVFDKIWQYAKDRNDLEFVQEQADYGQHLVELVINKALMPCCFTNKED